MCLLGYGFKTEKKAACKLAACLAAAALLACTFSMFILSPAKAVTVTKTRTIVGLPYDDMITGTGESWSQARAASTGEISLFKHFLSVGWLAEPRKLRRSYLYFDTSVIPDNAAITSATLSLYFYARTTYGNINVTVQSGMPTYPHVPLESGDYFYGFYSGNGGSVNMSSLSFGYVNISLTPQGISWINKAGYTKLCLRSHYDVDNVQPPTTVAVSFYSAEVGEDYAPKLYVTYEAESYRCILHGPYYESGRVAGTCIVATVEVENEGYFEYTLDGTDGSADTVTLDFEQRVLSITWNCSTAYLNTTRTITPRHDLAFEEFWLFVPAPNEWANIVSFNVLDLAGISWGYIEVQQCVGGQMRVIERCNVLSAFEVSFYLIVGRTYIVKVTANLGTANFGSYTIKPAESYTIIITREKFPPPPATLTPTATCLRRNGTHVEAYYVNPNRTATWVQYIIAHRKGQTWIVDYSLNSTLTGVSDSLVWTEADSRTDYLLTVRDSLGNVWTFSLPAPPATVNPWQTLDSLWHDSPVPFSQVVGAFLVLMVLGVFSFFNAEVGMFAAWASAAVLTYIGWLQVPYTLLVFALVIVIFTAYSRAKRLGEVEV